MHRRRSALAGSLVVVALGAAACGGGSEDAAITTTSTATPATSAPDDFTEVRTVDGSATGSTTDPEPDETVADGSSVDDDATTTAPTGDETPSDTDGEGAVVTTAATSDGASASTTSTTSTTTETGDTSAGAADRALAAAFTAQFDADGDDGFGSVFDTVCLGNEFVTAFGGAAAADADYGLNPTTVTVDSTLFGDEPLSKTTADALVATFGRCGDLDDLLLLILGVRPDEAALGACIIAEMPDGLLEASFSEDLQQIDGPALEEFEFAADDAFDACF